MSKNTGQMTVRTTAPDGSLIYFGYPDGTNPYGYNDSFTEKSNFLASMKSTIDFTESEVDDNYDRIQEVENAAPYVFDSAFTNRSFFVTIQPNYEIEKIIFRRSPGGGAGSPKVSITSPYNPEGGSIDILPEQGLTDNFGLGSQLIVRLGILNNYRGYLNGQPAYLPVTIRITVRDGSVKAYIQLKKRNF